MANLLWRQKGIFLMFYCRQVLVLVSPRWLWERCLCLLVAIWMCSSYFWKKDHGCGFFVLWCPPLHQCNVWQSCLFLLWLCIWCFYTAIYLVGGCAFDPTIALVGGVWCIVGGCDCFVEFFYYLCHVVCATVYIYIYIYINPIILPPAMGK